MPEGKREKHTWAKRFEGSIAQIRLINKLTHPGWKRKRNCILLGLEAAAREVVMPLVADMKGKKIIYDCRVSWVMRVDELTIERMA
jgi:hypothetical protein